METSRKRIIEFIENQKIKSKEFLKKTGLSKGFVDRTHIKSSASDVYMSKILEAYPELSAEWLLTGKGEMLKPNPNESNNAETPSAITIPEPEMYSDQDNIEVSNIENKYYEQLLNEKDKIIEALNETINAQRETINTQREVMDILRSTVDVIPKQKAG